MVNTHLVIFEVMCLGSLNWRLPIDDEDEHLTFNDRDLRTVIAAAQVQARRLHLYGSLPTQVQVIERTKKIRRTNCYIQIEDESLPAILGSRGQHLFSDQPSHAPRCLSRKLSSTMIALAATWTPWLRLAPTWNRPMERLDLFRSTHRPLRAIEPCP